MGALAALLLLAGCSAGVAGYGDPTAEQPGRPVETPAESAPAAGEARGLPEVPVRSTSIEDAMAPVIAEPNRIRIPALDIDLPVRAVGVQQDGSMEIPENPSVVGWYRFGPAPASERGATVLAAHVDSLRYGLGPFASLKTIPPNSEIVVLDERGVETVYRVQGIRQTGKAELVGTGVFDRSGERRLHRIQPGPLAAGCLARRHRKAQDRRRTRGQGALT